MRWGGFLIAGFTFGILVAASQSTVAPPMQKAHAEPVGENVSMVYMKAPEPEKVATPAAAIVKAAPQGKPAVSHDEDERAERLKMFDLRDNGETGSRFRAGPRGTIPVNR